MRIRLLTPNRPQRRWLAAIWIAALCVWAQPAAAYTDVEFGPDQPSYRVRSQGSAYQDVAGFIATYPFAIDADFNVRRIIQLSYALTLSADHPAMTTFLVDAASDSHSYSRPRRTAQTFSASYAPDAASLVGACNALRDALRQQGSSDAEIFSSDREITLVLEIDPDVNLTWGLGFSEPPQARSRNLTLTCEGRGYGTPTVDTASNLTKQEGVQSAELSLAERYGPSGVCMVVLSGTLVTTGPHMDVKFRYEHFDGQQSNVKTVNSGSRGVAHFEHQYVIPNQEGPEGGSMKMVGTVQAFESNAVAYSMNCVEGGASSLQVSLLPTVHLQARPVGQKNVGSQICPTHLQIQGKVEGQGGGSVAGQAFFVGDGWASPHYAYEVSGGNEALVSTNRALEWTPSAPQTLASAGSQPSALSQTLVVGFNVLGESNTEIASVAGQPFDVSCRLPVAAMQAAGGFGRVAAMNGAVRTDPVPRAPESQRAMRPIAAVTGSQVRAAAVPQREPIAARRLRLARSASSAPAPSGGIEGTDIGSGAAPAVPGIEGVDIGSSGASGPGRPPRRLRGEAHAVIQSAGAAVRALPPHSQVAKPVEEEVAAARKALSALSKVSSGDPHTARKRLGPVQSSVSALANRCGTMPRARSLASRCNATHKRCVAACDTKLCTCTPELAECLAPALKKRARSEATPPRQKAQSRLSR